MKTVRIAGVPEHFNLPWHLAIEEGAFEQRGIDLQWQDVPEGTGRMCQMLEKGETDLAVILTEGICKSIAEGNPSRILQKYVESPLLWGIHVAANSEFQHINELEGGTAAISRKGSGSHLMSYVLAKNNGWDPENLKFELVNNLDGGIEAIGSGKADFFMWERFTTKPFVDQGIFRRLGDCPTPWPCFVIAVRLEFLEKEPGVLRHVLEVINLYSSEINQIPSIDRTFANRYGQELSDIQQWLEITYWSQDQIHSQTIDKVIDTLINLNLLVNNIPADKLLTNL